MNMREAARSVRENAHAPYSNFQVGAAILDENAQHHASCNVENAAYPLGQCAEAGAIAAMCAAGEREIVEVAVIADAPAPVPPCGGCRQKIAEFAGADVVVTMSTMDGTTLQMTVAELLPGRFTLDHMANT